MTMPKATPFSLRELASIRRRLLRWYEREKRDLPWRRATDPYCIWVSEIMLQQTRVEAVIPYYKKFLRQFPTVASLARVPEESVLAAWSGLGYYSRARNLQRAAQAIVAQHAGRFPRDEQAALALPGVGTYTAAAVLSIAYGVPLAVLDGNVARVLSRLLMLRADVRDSKGKRQLSGCAVQLLHTRRPGDFNQAMMELGATVCVPVSPRCGECPLDAVCRARHNDETGKFPPSRGRQSETALRLMSAIVHDGTGRLLLEKRPDNAAWMAGFWEIPTWEADAKQSRSASHRGALRDRLRLGGALGSVRHSITRFRIVARVHQAALLDNGKALEESTSVRWVALSELERLPVSTITRKALRLLRRD